jgi:hypothetical protein
MRSVFEVATKYEHDSSKILCRENLKTHLATEYAEKISALVIKVDLLTFIG